TRQADTGVVAGADIGVDAKAFFDDALALFDGSLEYRLEAPLLVQHALGLGDDDLGPFLGGGQRFFDGGLNFGNAVGAVQHPYPLDPHTLDGIDNGIVGGSAFVVGT